MEKTIEGVTYVTIEEAAALLSTTLPRMLMLVKGGKVSGENLEDGWWISMGSLKKLGNQAPPLTASDCRTSCKATSCGCK